MLIDDLSHRCDVFTMPRLKSSWVVVSGINGDGTFQVRELLPLCEECAKKRRLASLSGAERVMQQTSRFLLGPLALLLAKVAALI
jgi:hypothetical protein